MFIVSASKYEEDRLKEAGEVLSSVLNDKLVPREVIHMQS